MMSDFSSELGNIYTIEDVKTLSEENIPKSNAEIYNIKDDSKFLVWSDEALEFESYPLLLSRNGEIWKFDKITPLPVYISILNDVTIRRYDSYVASASKKILFKNSIGAHKSGSDPYATQIRNDFDFDKAIEVKSQKTPILISNDGWHNYWHVHAQSLLALYSIMNWADLQSTPIVCGHLTNWHKQILEIFGIESQNILELKNEYNYCKAVVYPSALDPRAFLNIDPRMRDVFSLMKQNAKVRYPSVFEGDRPKFIYVSRRDAQHRSIKDEHILVEALGKLGFIEIIPGHLSYVEQVAAFSEAKVIVGPHGAGLTNIGYAPKGALVVEIFDQNYMNYVYYVTSRICELKYECILFSGELTNGQMQLSVNPLTIMQAVLRYMDIHHIELNS